MTGTDASSERSMRRGQHEIHRDPDHGSFPDRGGIYGGKWLKGQNGAAIFVSQDDLEYEGTDIVLQ